MEAVHVFIYVNPTSGGNLAGELLKLPIKKTSFAFEDEELMTQFQVRIYDLKTKESREEGFAELVKFKEAGNHVKACAAGGDGTVKWVISELVKHEITDVAIGVIPFGTGNDMARILGWGATAPVPLVGGSEMPALKAIVRNFVLGEEIQLDVWEVILKVDEATGRFDVAEKGEIVERADKAKEVVEHMINYFSLGQDARAVFGFETHRRTTQFLNKVQYALEGAKLALPNFHRTLPGAALTLGTGDAWVGVPKIHDNHGVIFQNIPSYAAGSDFWDAQQLWTPEKDLLCPQHVGDGLFETQALGHIVDVALHKGTLGTMDATKKLGQANAAVLTFDGSAKYPIYCQVDGEPSRMVNPTSVAIRAAFPVRMIMRNEARLKLMRSLKDETLVKSGFLLKAQRRNAKAATNTAWNNRFLALVQGPSGARLQWYKGKELRNHVVVEKGKFEVEPVMHGGPRPNTCFTVKTKERTIHLAASSEVQRNEWLQALLIMLA